MYYCYQLQELISRWDTRTSPDVSSSLFTYSSLQLNYDTLVLPEYFLSRPNDNCYISNGRRFTKSAMHILLLSTFHVSSINYSLVCSLPIHTRSSSNTEGPRAHCQLKSCKMLDKCSTDCIWKSLQPVNDLQSHSRSLPLLPFYRPYTISYQSSVVSISLFCTVFEILTLICQKIKTSHDLAHANLGTVWHHKTNTSQAKL